MTTKMENIHQRGLFSNMSTIGVHVAKESKYRILSDQLPWGLLAKVANKHRSNRINIHRGAPLNLRLHLGAYIVQTMDGLTDRKTEEIVRYHAGVRLLCGVAESGETIDHTSIETFRNMLSSEGAEELNKIIVQHAVKKEFTGSNLCSSDTTVQEAPIAYPTEVGHLRNISEKLTGIGKRIKKGIASKVEDLKRDVEKIYTEIRLFTKGKKTKVIEKKKKLGKKLRRKVSEMLKVVEEAVYEMSASAKVQYESDLDLFRNMLKQIDVWMKSGWHPSGKIISLWHEEARAITRGKASRAMEFGRRWSITRLDGGYIIGRACKKLGSDTDGRITAEVLPQFEEVMGEMPTMFVYDRGGDEAPNHEALRKAKVKRNCIFRKGKNKMDVGPRILTSAKRERALSEASIAVIKGKKYNFNKPRSRSMVSCVTKGQMAILGANLTKLVKDLRGDVIIAEAV